MESLRSPATSHLLRTRQLSATSLVDWGLNAPVWYAIPPSSEGLKAFRSGHVAQDPYAWEGLATALEANSDDANADLAKHATVHLINGEPIPEACLKLLKAPCQAEVPAPRTVEWLYDLAVQHGVRALHQGTMQV